MKSLLLHSGGMDSTILGKMLKDSGEEFGSLYFNFGHNAHSREIRAVRDTSGMLDISSEVIDLSSMRSAFVSSNASLLAPQPNPGKHVLELGGLILLVPALAYAKRLGVNKLYIGYTKLDSDYSAEYSKVFLDGLSDLVVKAGYEKIEIAAPLIDTPKSEVLKSGLQYGGLLAKSWSCVYDGEYHCGTCQAWQSRMNAFKELGVDDPTQYQ